MFPKRLTFQIKNPENPKKNTDKNLAQYDQTSDFSINLMLYLSVDMHSFRLKFYESTNSSTARYHDVIVQTNTLIFNSLMDEKKTLVTVKIY